MADKFDKETASKMYQRMKSEGCSTKFIQDMIMTVFPNADLDEVILFMADSIKNPPAKKVTVLMSPDEVRSRRRNTPTTEISHYSNDTGCASSSRPTSC